LAFNEPHGGGSVLSKTFADLFSRTKKPSGKSRQTSQHTYTPARQRALAQRSYGLGALAVVLVLLALAQFGEDGLATYFKLRAHEQELVDDVLILEEENEEFRQQLVGLASDPSKLETMAREEHNMQKPQEEVLTVLPEAFVQETLFQ